MARIRTIKPSFFSSLSITALPKTTRLTFIGLWCYVDDSGRAVDDSRLVKAEIWPLDDDVSAKKVDADLQRLADAGLIERYEAGGRRYLRVVGWSEHQRINRPQPSRLPAPSLNGHGVSTDDSVNVHGTRTEDSPPEGNKEGKGKEPPLQTPVTHEEPVDNPQQELIDQAVAMAARRYGEQQVANGKGTSATGLASWWLQENSTGAKARATNLLTEYDLGATTLADALLQPNPPWLRNYRRRATT